MATLPAPRHGTAPPRGNGQLAATRCREVPGEDGLCSAPLGAPLTVLLLTRSTCTHTRVRHRHEGTRATWAGSALARGYSHQQTVQVGNSVRGQRLDPEHREHNSEPHCGTERPSARRDESPAAPLGAGHGQAAPTSTWLLMQQRRTGAPIGATALKPRAGPQPPADHPALESREQQHPAGARS